MKQNENIMYQNLWDADTDMLKEEFSLVTYIRKRERLNVSDLKLPFQNKNLNLVSVYITLIKQQN